MAPSLPAKNPLNRNKMKLLIPVIATAILAYVLELFLPWWSVALAGGAVAFFFAGKDLRNFAAGFLGVFLMWTVLAVILNGDSQLGGMVGELIPVGGGLGVLPLALLSGVIGGLAGGLGALSGGAFKNALSSK